MFWVAESLVTAAVPLAPEMVLRTLAGVTGGDVPPLLTVRLSGGHVLGGHLVMVGADRGNDVVLLADPDTGHIGYALLSSVVAVEVRNPEPFVDLLTGGRVPVPHTGEPVSRLALQREFAPDERFPLAVDWAALAESGLVAGNLAGLLRALRAAVTQVCADDMGRRAWARIGTLRVEHHAGSSLSVLPTADGVAVRVDLTAALPRALSDELVEKFNAVL